MKQKKDTSTRLNLDYIERRERTSPEIVILEDLETNLDTDYIKDTETSLDPDYIERRERTSSEILKTEKRAWIPITSKGESAPHWKS